MVFGPDPFGGSLHAALLKWQGSQCDVHWHSVRGADKQDSIGQCKFTSGAAAGRKGFEQFVSEHLFLAEACQQRQIDVLSQARFGPALDGDAANKAERPTALLAKRLNFFGSPEDAGYMNHLLRL